MKLVACHAPESPFDAAGDGVARQAAGGRQGGRTRRISVNDFVHEENGVAVDNVAFVNDLAEDRFVFNTTPNAATNFDLIDMASFTAAGGEGVDDQIHLENFIFTALQSAGGTNLGTLGANFYREGAFFTGNGAADPIGIYNNTFTGQLFYNPTFGVAGDSVLFAVVGGGVAGGSAALSAEEFTLT